MTGLANSWLLLEAPEAETGLPWAGELRLPIRRPRKVRPPESTNADEHCRRLAWRSRRSLDLPFRLWKLGTRNLHCSAFGHGLTQGCVLICLCRCGRFGVCLALGANTPNLPLNPSTRFRPFCCAGSARVAFVSRRQAARVRNLLKSRQELSSDCLRRLPIVLGAQKFDRNPLPPED